MAEIDITIYSLFEEILVDLGATQITLTRYATIFGLVYNTISVLIGIFAVLNSVLAFTDSNKIVREVFLCLNALFVSGILGNFGSRQTDSLKQKTDIDLIVRWLVTVRVQMGYVSLPASFIIDTNFTGSRISPPNPMILLPPPPVGTNSGIILGDMIKKNPNLRSKILTLQSLIDYKQALLYRRPSL